jgi:HEAT repeat protein
VVPPKHERCDCCAYELTGLENGLCPECGWSYQTDRVPPRKRLRATLRASGLLGLSAALWMTPTVAREGWLAPVPGLALAAALPYAGSGDSAVHGELARRLDRSSLSAWERRTLADRCTSIIASRHDERQRAGAATLLAKVRTDATAHARILIGCLNDSSAVVRGCIVDVLVVAAMPDDDGRDRLGIIERGKIVAALATAAACDESESVRRRAIDGLGRAGTFDHDATDVFIGALRDPAPRVRERALYSMCGRFAPLAPDSAISAIEAAAHDQHDGVREAAVFALGRLAAGLDRAVMPIATALHDGSPAVRRQAVENLARLGARAAPAWGELMLSVDDEDPIVQEAAMDSLRRLERRS